MAKSEQSMKGIVARGNVLQQANNPDTSQKMDKVEGGDVKQEKSIPKENILQVGKYRAVGLWAIIGLVVVIVGSLLIQHLIK